MGDIFGPPWDQHQVLSSKPILSRGLPSILWNLSGGERLPNASLFLTAKPLGDPFKHSLSGCTPDPRRQNVHLYIESEKPCFQTPDSTVNICEILCVFLFNFFSELISNLGDYKNRTEISRYLSLLFSHILSPLSHLLFPTHIFFPWTLREMQMQTFGHLNLFIHPKGHIF